jgi:hypothetical protein
VSPAATTVAVPLLARLLGLKEREWQMGSTRGDQGSQTSEWEYESVDLYDWKHDNFSEICVVCRCCNCNGSKFQTTKYMLLLIFDDLSSSRVRFCAFSYDIEIKRQVHMSSSIHACTWYNILSVSKPGNKMEPAKQ